jgi:four helix bundle protein
VASDRWSVAGGRWSVVGGRWSVVGGRWPVLQKSQPCPRGKIARTATRPSFRKKMAGFVSALSVNATLAMTVRTYRELSAWQRGMALVEACYRGTKGFPPDERFGLTSQLRRAAVSVPSNVAEGACRLTTRAFVNHVGIALGSLAEVETCIEVALRLDYLPPDQAQTLLELAGLVGRLLNGLVRSLRSREPRV